MRESQCFWDVLRKRQSTRQGEMSLAFGLVLATVAVFGCAPATAETISVFAAASLTDSLKEIAAGYANTSGDKVVFNFAASSFLARQVEEGAAADIFFSADEERVDALQGGGLIAPGTRKSHLYNTLVVVVAADSDLQLKSAADLADARFKRLALADPQTVPAGIYALKYFQQAKLWPVLEPKVVPTDNVRAALSAVESGNVEAGVVYKTDAAISRKVKIAYEIPQREGPFISYPVAMLKDAPHPESARKFLQYLTSAEADVVFHKFGFIVLNSQ
jgi:molybdate transport system substrate-binding protein